ncbi:hypothetical protein [Paraburkholderia graminis]|jgi:hypothetical protein
MSERLVDVIDSSGTVLHTYPITLGESGNVPDDAEYQAKALEAAAHSRLVPDAELRTLTARMHTGRGGRWRPTGMTLRKIQKRNWVWTRLFGNAPICSGRKRDVLMGVRRSTGIALSTSIFGSGPTFCGSRKEVPKGDRTNIGVGLSISRLSDSRGPGMSGAYRMATASIGDISLDQADLVEAD